MKECVGGYYRIRKGDRTDPKEEHRKLQKGYGIKHPEKTIGYAGLFFGKGDVFVSEAVERSMEEELFRNFVLDCLKNYERENYGDISREDTELNGESRRLGNGDRVMGRYGYYYDNRYTGKSQYDEIIRIRTWEGNIWITYDAEPDLFLLLKENRETQEPVKEEKGTRVSEAGQTEETDGIAFLKEYRAHPEKYLPMTVNQYIHVDEQEGNSTNLFWNAGIFEDQRPYFAKCWKFDNVTSLEIFISADGMERWDAEHLAVPKMISRGLLEADDVRKIPPAVFRNTEQKGREFYMVHLVLEDGKPTQNIRWVGNRYSFEELNRLNANLRWIV